MASLASGFVQSSPTFLSPVFGRKCCPRRAQHYSRQPSVSMRDEIVRTLSRNGDVSATVIAGTAVVAESIRVHGTSAVATQALGRALMCALLMSATKTEDSTLQLQWRGDGPLGGVTAIASGQTNVRGYVGAPRTQVAPTSSGELNVSAAVGRGVLAVVRSTQFTKQPYTGLVRIESGEIAQDVAAYLAESEQTPSAISAGVRLASNGSVEHAGGFLVQLLPGASEQSISTLEKNVNSLPPVTELMKSGSTASDILNLLMKGFDCMQIVTSAPLWKCSCNVDRLKRTVKLLPKSEIEEVLAKEEKIEARCEFCRTQYTLTSKEVEILLR